jgi:hypothetical protein
VSDIDTVVVDSLKALDPEWPIREADIAQRGLARQKSAMCGRLRVGKDFLHARRLVGAAMCSAILLTMRTAPLICTGR